MEKDTIIELLKQNQDYIESHGAVRIGLFGSYSRNLQTPYSDIDLIIDIRKDAKSFDNFMDLVYYLERLLGNEVDLITTDSITPEVLNHISKEVVYAY